jgi:hypothetical protein
MYYERCGTKCAFTGRTFHVMFRTGDTEHATLMFSVSLRKNEIAIFFSVRRIENGPSDEAL